MPTKMIIPQIGEKLKDLRDTYNLSQTKMAEQLEQVLYNKLNIRYGIQQSDVSRLETEKAIIDLHKLLAYTLLCKVDADSLLTPEFDGLLHNAEAIHLHTFKNDTEAEQQLLELERGGRILVSPEFPSSFFDLSKNSRRYQQLNAPGYQACEIYTAESFLQFLFSPVSLYSLDDKARILNRCIAYFQSNINRNLYFFSARQLPKLSQLPTLQLLPQRKTLLISAPANHFHTGDAFIEIRDKKIYADTDHFYSKLPTFENSTIYLRIGLETLDKMRTGEPARNAILYFAEAVKQARDNNAMTVIQSFSPEIQMMVARNKRPQPAI